MNNFYIFGLQRTGTTFVENLLTMNFDCIVSNNGRPYWKHTHEIPDISDRPSFLTVKNPYTWVESICFREHADLPPTALNRYGYDVHEFSEHKANTFNVRTLAKIYNNYYNTWITSAAHMIRYEDVLTDSGLNTFIDSVKFDRTTTSIEKPAPGSLFMSEGYSDQMASYYLQQQPTQLSQQQLDDINSQLDLRLLQKLGYTKIHAR